MTIVKVATLKPAKIKAIKEVFKLYFDDVVIISYDTNSKIPEQPINHEILEGAENCIEQLKEDNKTYDFLVACESGMIFVNKLCFNIQAVIIEDSAGKRGTGLSGGYQIPEQHVREALATNTSKMMSRVLGNKGEVKALTKDRYTSEMLTGDATLMALCGVLNGEDW